MNKLLSTLACCTALAMPAQAATFDQTVQDYFHTEWRTHPVLATSLGLHDGDATLGDLSPAAWAALSRARHGTLDALRAIPASSLTPLQRDDRDILIAQIGGDLLADDTLAGWKHNPDSYVSLATNAVYTLIARDFAPATTRMRDAIARENAIPAALTQAGRNLTDLPPVFVEIAQEDADGAASFLARDVPAAFAGVTDAGLQRQLKTSTDTSVAAMKQFRAWLDGQAKTAHGSFALGHANFQALLAADLITLTPEQVLAAGRAQLARDQASFSVASTKLDPQHPDRALAIVGADHPTAAQLVPMAAGQLAELRRFVIDHHIATLPNATLPEVGETPPFQRAETFGEMDPPGPFETMATTAHYYITPPDASAPPAAQLALLSYFNRSLLLNLGVHETMPGHFVQFLFAKANPDWSLVRKTAHSYTATEGWAHYAEQMMLDEGLHPGDTRLQLAQLQDAMLRDCRLVASVQMHTQGMSLADAASMMQTQCHQPHDVGYKEARRGTADPGYFSYTIGKLMILKLRADVQAQEGGAFTLAHFHDRFLNAGLVPIAIIRREITGKDGAAL